MTLITRGGAIGIDDESNVSEAPPGHDISEVADGHK